jgi:hypothetical protein
VWECWWGVSGWGVSRCVGVSSVVLGVEWCVGECVWLWGVVCMVGCGWCGVEWCGSVRSVWEWRWRVLLHS